MNNLPSNILYPYNSINNNQRNKMNYQQQYNKKQQDYLNKQKYNSINSKIIENNEPSKEELNKILDKIKNKKIIPKSDKKINISIIEEINEEEELDKPNINKEEELDKPNINKEEELDKPNINNNNTEEKDSVEQNVNDKQENNETDETEIDEKLTNAFYQNMDNEINNNALDSDDEEGRL